MTGIDPPRALDGLIAPGASTGPAGTDRADQPTTAAEGAAAATASPGTTANEVVARLAQAIDSGHLAPSDAIAQLLDTSLRGLDSADHTELRALVSELLASDPYLADLLRDLGAPP